MEFVEARDARSMDGLRIAFTVNTCGPWSESAKYIYEVKGMSYVPVAQYGGQPNEDLVAWTGHGNAPVVMWNDEPARAGWAEILMQAERIAPEPQLLPEDPAQRAQVFGIANELAGEWGFGWCRRIQIIEPTEDDQEGIRGEGGKLLRERYGAKLKPSERAPHRCVQILDFLRDVLDAQKAKGSKYLVGDGLTAADIYWAAFSEMLEPMADDLCPMPGPMREIYGGVGEIIEGAKHPILFEHRDYIFGKYIKTPLDFMDTR